MQDRGILFVERPIRGLHQLSQTPPLRPQQLLALQLSILARPEVRGGDLLDLIAQQVFARPPIRQRVPALGQARLELPPPRKRRLVSHACVGEPAELVEQVQLHRRSEEGLVIVLAVDVHEESTESLEDAERGRPAIDMDTVPPRAREDAAENHLGCAALQKILLVQELCDGTGFLEGEDPRDFGFLSARSDQISRGAPPYQEVHRIHEDGLSGARLAGEDRETVRKLQRDCVDDGEVADAEFCQHTA